MLHLSSLDVRHLARELSVLDGAYIDNIYQTDANEFLIKLRHKERGRYFLVVQPGSFAALADAPPETPERPSAFATALRKFASNGRVRRVRQHSFDRVLVLDIERGGDPSRLVVELFGKGNLIVVDSIETIRMTWRQGDFAHRSLRPGKPFKFPPERPDPAEWDAKALANLAEGSKRDVVRFLAVEAGLGGDLAQAVVDAPGIEAGAPASATSVEGWTAICGAIGEILARTAEPVTWTDKSGVRAAALTLGATEQQEQKQHGSLSEAILHAAADQKVERAKEPDEESKRLSRQKDHQAEAIRRLSTDAAALRSVAGTFQQDSAALDGLLTKLRAAIEEDGWQRLRRPRTEDDTRPEIVDVNPARRIIRLRLGDAVVSMRPEESTASNISAIFDEAKRMERKATSAERARGSTEHLLSKRTKANAAGRGARQATKPPGRRHWFFSYRWFFTTAGTLVIGGRNAQSNDKLVRKHLKAGDVYVHADVHGAPSCVLKLAGKDPSEADLEEACRFAVTFSKAFNQFTTSQAFWVKPEQVSKTAQAGEYVPRGAFIIRGERNYRRRLPLEAGVGRIRLSKEGAPLGPDEEHPAGSQEILMGGPWSSVQARCADAVRVVRGQTAAAEVAKRLAVRMAATPDETLAALPSGRLQLDVEGAG